MEKHYFKYASGYINIDDENLYLTNSGNWQETRELKEKSPKTKRENSFRITGNNIFLFIVFAAVVVASFFMFDKAHYKAIGGLLVLAYFVYKYFELEMGKRYKIPLSKIESVEKFDKGIKIIFRNEANKPDVEIIDNVEPKGLGILSSLSLITIKN